MTESTIANLSRPSITPLPAPKSASLRDLPLAMWRQTEISSEKYDFNNLTHMISLVEQPINVNKLNRCLRILFTKHPALSARISVNSDDTYIFYSAPDRPQFIEIDHRSIYVDAGSREISEETKSILRDLVWNRFCVIQSKPLSEALHRFFLIRVPSGRSIIGFVLHHSIADAISSRIIAEDLVSLYEGLPQSSDMTNGYRNVDFIDYLINLEKWYASDDHKECAKPLEEEICLIVDNDLKLFGVEKSYELSKARGSIHVNLDPNLTDQLIEYTRSRSSSLFSLILLLSLLADYVLFKTSDAVTRIIHHGRDETALFSAVGCFVTEVPMISRLKEEDSFDDALRGVQRSYLRILQSPPVMSNIIPAISTVTRLFNFLDMGNIIRKPGLFANPVTLDRPDNTWLGTKTKGSSQSYTPSDVLMAIVSPSGISVEARFDDSAENRTANRLRLEVMRKIAETVVEGANPKLADLALLDMSEIEEKLAISS